jgi:hypothetical protein
MIGVLLDGGSPAMFWQRCTEEDGGTRTAFLAALAMHGESIDTWLSVAREIAPEEDINNINSLAVECEQRSKGLIKQIGRRLLSFDLSKCSDIPLRFFLYFAQLQVARRTAPNLLVYGAAIRTIVQRLGSDEGVIGFQKRLCESFNTATSPFFGTSIAWPAGAPLGEYSVDSYEDAEKEGLSALGFFDRNDITEDGIFCLDVLLLKLIDKIAPGLARDGKKSFAQDAPFKRWEPRNGKFIWRSTLAKIVWDYIVCPRAEKAKGRERTPFRMSTELSRTISLGRMGRDTKLQRSTSEGDLIVLVEPPKGIALTLPFESTRVQKENSVVTLRQVLSPQAMKTYLALLIAWFDAGMESDGSFSIEGVNKILELTGTKKYTREIAGKIYPRFATQDVNETKAHLELFKGIRVKAAGDFEVVGNGADALVQEIRERSTKRHFALQHSRLIAKHMREGYLQIPRAVARLEARDVSIGIGIATVIRKRILASMVKGSGTVQAPIGEWLEASGINQATEIRKKGAEPFWMKTTGDLSRIAEEGSLGTITIDGDALEAVCSITVSEDLRAAYRPLLESRAKHKLAEEKALVKAKAPNRAMD